MVVYMHQFESQIRFDSIRFVLEIEEATANSIAIFSRAYTT